MKNYTTKKQLRVHWILPPSKQRVRRGKEAKGKNGEGMVAEDMEAQSHVNEPAHLERWYITPGGAPKERAKKPKEENRL